MAEKVLLAIDIGTTNTKGALFRLDGSIMAASSRRHQVSSPEEGWAVHDAEDVWWKEVREICRDLTGREDVSVGDILSVGIGTLSPALLPVDEEGKALYPAMLYGMDRRAVGEMEELSKCFAEQVAEQGPELISPLSPGPKILWLKRHEPDIFQKAAYFVSASAFIVHRFTGHMVADYASSRIGGMPFSLKDFRWDEEMCRACGITPEKLPELKFGTELAGTVTAQAAAETGLAPGTPVAVGTGDFPAECLSYGTVYGSQIKISFGTTVGVNFGSDHAYTLFKDYDYKHPKKGIRGGAMSNGCSTIDWMLAMLSGIGAEQPVSDEILAEMADQVPAGSNGLLMLPYLNGERTPFMDPYAKGVIFGLQARHTQAELYKASLEAVAYSIRHMLQRAPEHVRDAVVLGGGTKIPGLLQVVSDVTGFRLTKLDLLNGSLLGDAFIAGMACGIYHKLEDIDSWIKVTGVVEPRPELKETYDKGFRKYMELYAATAELMH